MSGWRGHVPHLPDPAGEWRCAACGRRSWTWHGDRPCTAGRVRWAIVAAVDNLRAWAIRTMRRLEP